MKKFGVWEKGQLSIDAIIKEAWKDSHIEKAGALASFFGLVRGETHQNEPVKCISFEAYKEHVEQSFERIADNVKREYDVLEIFIHHVTGDLDVGDLIMAVLVLGSSRKNVFPALKEVVEMVKKESLIWKKEYLRNGECHWIEYDPL